MENKNTQSAQKRKNKILKVTQEEIKGSQIEEYQNDPSEFTLLSFKENTDINIISKSKEEIVFDIKGIDPPLANALRRILLAEIPMMAIENVTIYQNTSILPDESFCHRLGLIPIYADADEFQYKKEKDDFNENNSIKFKLKVACYKNEKGEIVNSEIYSRDLVFVPQGKQEEKFVGSETIRPVHDDILLMKLGVGQEIECEMYCVKGIGKTHAKWQTVCTAYYKLMNDIKFSEEIKGEDAEELKSLCPMKVFDVKKDKAVVKNIRNCTTCRECIRNEKFGKKINLGKISDHYEFHIESVGVYDAEDLFYRALRVLKEKCDMWAGILMEKIADKKNS
jgi:DNA-directed RNA polymerase I and III subunit RPAC1